MEPILSSFDMEGIARYISEKACRRIVVMCGAGISTSAGIPDFRTPGTGLYDNLQRFNLPQAESIFEMGFFRENPAAFYELVREMWPGNFEATPAHYFIRLLHDKGLLLRCYSQNIDSLERRAGLPAEKLVAAHGNFDEAHVIDTEPEVKVDINELKAALDQGEEGWKRLREEKGGLVKPKIVFFGEELPERFARLHRTDLSRVRSLDRYGHITGCAALCRACGLYRWFCTARADQQRPGRHMRPPEVRLPLPSCREGAELEGRFSRRGLRCRLQEAGQVAWMERRPTSLDRLKGQSASSQSSL